MRGEPREAPSGERALIEQAQQGDQLALRALYQRYSAELFRTAILPIVHDRALALDLLADTFVIAIEKLDRYQWQSGGLRPWLARIAKNLCFDHLRRNQRFVAWPDHHEVVADMDIEGLLDHAEQADHAHTQVQSCMAELTPRYRKVITLRLVEQRSRSETAALLDISVGTLDVLLCRACKAFRKHWQARYGTLANAPPARRRKLGPRSA